MQASKRRNLFISYFLFICFGGCPSFVQAQEIPDEPPIVVEQQLEDMAADNEDAETEDDSYLQQLVHFSKEPLNLNYADAGLLQELKLLSPLQISNLLCYRKLLGNFINIYELQAVPGWNTELIRKLLPFITVNEKQPVFKSLKKRLKDGENLLLFRSSTPLEKSKGYLSDSSIDRNYYPGSPQKLLLRYKYQSGNLLQYGFTAEKDAGEQFFKGAQKNGFDFYSAHFFVRNLGIIKSLALGDFTVSMGQGLTEWQSFALYKGSEITSVKRQSDILRPYNSAGEIIFNRGAGITLQKKKWQATTFFSYRKIDATLNFDPANSENSVSSLQSSGLHRTSNEINGRASDGKLNFGGNIGYSTEKFHFGINGVHYDFKFPIKKQDYWYNKYALSGKHFGNYSLDYSYTFRNMHFFGEAAIDEKENNAFVNGLLINLDAKVAMSFLYRNISKAYQSLYGNAFTENTSPTNESGLYSGITFSPSDVLKFDAFADFYHFPWLKYRTDAPTDGYDYMIQLTYQPNKQTVLSSRFKIGNKPINDNPDGVALNPVIGRPKQNWRTQLNYKINRAFNFDSRVELAWFDKRSDHSENGFLMYTEVAYKPPLRSFSGNFRFSYFETDGYDSRIYAFEKDVLYGYSIPVFFDKGYRYYVNFHYKIIRNISVWLRFSQTVYSAKSEIGSGLDNIPGNKKSEIKIQVSYAF